MTRFRSALGLTAVFVVLSTSAWSADDALKGKGTGLARLIGNPEEAFKKMDANGDKKVSKEEFANYLTAVTNGKLKAAITDRLFERTDTDKDGFLSLEELKKLSTVGRNPAETKAVPAPRPAAEPLALTPRDWKSGPAAALPPTQLDRLLAECLKADQRSPATLINDEQFLRRVTLDLTGKLPAAADVEAFRTSTDPHKRAQRIDQLLHSDDFAHHWARFWRDVMQAKASSTLIIFDLHRGAALEDWLFQQFKANRSWAEITRAIITAEGAVEVPGPTKNGAVGFLLCHDGPDAPAARAADTSRVFLGIQIECAQCHNHPTDIWKRQQFHELAAYFARGKEGKTNGAGANRGLQLTSLSQGEYQMSGKDNPNQLTTVHPRFFLTGTALGEGKSDRERRQALADLVTSKDNPWFPAAFVNRTWGQLMGQAFVQPVDGMGPSQEPIYPEVLTGLANTFRASDYNIKELFGTITNSQAYQRQVRLGETSNQHLRFTATYPTRMRGDVMWDSLTAALGAFAERSPLPTGLREVLGRIRTPDYQTIFKRVFDFDPSANADEVEGSVPQALMLMNNRQINSRIKATGDTVLARILKDKPQDDDAIRQVYVQVLNRRPTEHELAACRDYLKQVGNRAEAFEDLLWVLINSAEFKTKH